VDRRRCGGDAVVTLVALSASYGAGGSRALPKLDRTHAEYLRHFYNAEIDDPRLYHLMIDSTAIALDACAELIVRAAGSMTSDPAAG
jgi:hypothetical protein